jgi:glycosyl hydrolase family 123
MRNPPRQLLWAVLLFSTAVMAQSRPAVWSESATTKIRPDAQPGSQAALHLVAARNEFVSFQVGLHGGAAGLTGVSAQLTALEGPSRIEGNSITLYQEVFLDITQHSTPDSQLGPWPDGLLPDVDETVGEKRRAFPFDIPAGEARAIWVDVLVPMKAPPGQYKGTVLVTADNGYKSKVQVHLTVVDALLPSTPSLRTAFLLWPPHVCRAYTGTPDCGEETLVPLLQMFHRMALEHRLTLASAFPRVPGQATWNLPDWETFEARWGAFLDGTVPLRLPGARMTSWQYLGPPTAEGLAQFQEEARSRGWLSRAFDYVGDEPPYGISFQDVEQRATLSRQAAPEVNTLLTSTITDLETYGLVGLIDSIVVLVNYMDGTRPPYVGNQVEGYTDFVALPNRELWMYQSCMSQGCVASEYAPENQPGQGWPSYMIDRQATKARALEWVSFLEGATGELYYQTVGMLSTAWTNQFRFNGNGDGTLFYPGTPSSIGGSTAVPLPSIRLKLIRLGIQDYEWLEAVSDAGDPEFARGVARRLIPAAWRVPDDGAAFDAARLCLIQRYLELTGAKNIDAELPARCLGPADPSSQPGR